MANTFDRKEVIEHLITNVEGFDESDRATLDKFNDDVIYSFVDNDDKEEDEEDEEEYEEEEAEEETAPRKKVGNKRSTVSNSYNLPPDMQRVLNRAIAKDKADKDKFIKTIVANSRFTAEFLGKKEIEELEEMAGMVKNSAPPRRDSYVGSNVPMIRNSASGTKKSAPLIIPVMNFTNAKD